MSCDDVVLYMSLIRQINTIVHNTAYTPRGITLRFRVATFVGVFSEPWIRGTYKSCNKVITYHYQTHKRRKRGEEMNNK